MLTIKRLSPKEAEPPVATSELKAPATTEATPEIQTTRSNGTFKYKMTGRYAFGYSDPRILYGSSSTAAWGFSPNAEHMQTEHYAIDMTDEQLRSAWLLLFGSDPISFNAIGERSDGDDFRIAYEAYRRGLLHEENNINSYSRYYVLKK